jgi:miniconductance mechanosensitive channel
MINDYKELLREFLSGLSLSLNQVDVFELIVLLLSVGVLSYLAYFIAKNIILSIVGRVTKRTAFVWDDILFKNRVFRKLSHLAPAVVIYILIPHVLGDYKGWLKMIMGLTNIYMIITVLLVISAFINALHDIYKLSEASKTKSIKSYVQLVKIIVFFIGGIIIISVIIGKSPGLLLTGLGAFAAVLLLVFRDTILGLVAGVQISSNDMVRPGDWITMSKYGADGTVLEITLHTVKVQNWDKTVTTIPTYALVSDSFQNWRGMEESGGRRIKRSININMKSVKFCTPEMLEKFRKIQVLEGYIDYKQEELEKHNNKYKIDESILVNGRRQTNLGVFRAYLERYLRRNENINEEMTFIIRQLQPTETGLPIEIYVFSKVQAWAEYESIQADIFDHILAVIPEFELQVFQNPSGDDFKKLTN